MSRDQVVSETTRRVIVQEIARCQTRLRAFVRCLFVRSDDVDDVLQDINAVLWEKADEFKRVSAAYETLGDKEKKAKFDRGEIDGEGRLKITGRVKEIFKTSKGKYVAPNPIENELLLHERAEVRQILDGTVWLASPVGADWQGSMTVSTVSARRGIGARLPGFLPFQPPRVGETIEVDVALKRSR